MAGTVADRPVTMYLQRTGNAVNGYYHFNDEQVPIRLNDEHSGADSINMEVYDNEVQETFRGTLYNGTYSGTRTLTKDGKASTATFQVTETSVPTVPKCDVVYTAYNTTYPIGKAGDDAPSFSYFASALWPATGSAEPMAAFLKKWVNEQYGNKDQALPIGRFFVRQKNKDLADWKKDLATYKKEELTEYPSGHSISTERRLMVMYASDRYLSIADQNYAFTGGAHGNYGTSCSVIDLKRLRTLRLSDIMMPTAKKKLSAALDEAVRAKLKIPKGVKLNDEEQGLLFVERIEPNDNFYITAKGIGFYYVPYEIAAYAFGEIDLFIPFERLKGCLQASFMK